MSYTSLAVADADGILENTYEYKNGHGSAPFIWDALCRKYELGESYDSWQKLWETDVPFTPLHYNVMQITLDNCVLRRADMELLAKCLQIFEKEFHNPQRVCSLPQQALDILEAHANGAEFIAWNHTSVCDEWYHVRNEETEEREGYNVLTGTMHHFVELLPLEELAGKEVGDSSV